MAPYHLISSTGQWFGVRATVACLANQTTCTFEDPTHALRRRARSALRTQGPSVADVVAFANAGSPT